MLSKGRIAALILVGVMSVTSANFIYGKDNAKDAEISTMSDADIATIGDAISCFNDVCGVEFVVDDNDNGLVPVAYIYEPDNNGNQEDESGRPVILSNEDDEEVIEDINLDGIASVVGVYRYGSVQYIGNSYSTGIYSTTPNPSADTCNCNVFCIDPGRNGPSAGAVNSISFSSSEITDEVIRKLMYYSWGAPGWCWDARAHYNDCLPDNMENANGYYMMSHVVLSYGFSERNLPGGQGWELGATAFSTDMYNALINDPKLKAPPSTFHVYLLDAGDNSIQRMATWEHNPSGTAKLKKVSTSAYISPLYNFENIVYEVYEDSACTLSAKDTMGNKVVLSVNKKSGESQTVSMSPGTYYAKEAYLENGNTWYKLDKSVHTFTITDDATTVINVSDEPIEIELSIRKKSANPDKTDNNTKYTLTGAVYYVYTDKDCTVRARGFDGKTVKLVTGEEQLSSKGVKYADSNVVRLPADQYYVREISNPDGFELDDTVYDLEKLDAGLMVAGASYRLSVTEDEESSGIRLYKELVNVGTINADIDNLSSRHYSMKGVVYSVYANKNADGSLSNRVGKFVMKSNGQGVVVENRIDGYADKITTSPSGPYKYVLEGLAVDSTYYVKETATYYKWNEDETWSSYGIRDDNKIYEITSPKEGETLRIIRQDGIVYGSLSLKKTQKKNADINDAELSQSINRKIAAVNCSYGADGYSVYGLGHNIYTVYSISSATDRKVTDNDIVGRFETQEYNSNGNAHTIVRSTVTYNKYYEKDVENNSDTMHGLPLGYYLIKETKVKSGGYNSGKEIPVYLTQENKTIPKTDEHIAIVCGSGVDNPVDISNEDYEISYAYPSDYSGPEAYGGARATVVSNEDMIYGSIGLRKESGNTKLTGDNPCYSLSGAVYDVYYYSNQSLRDKDISDKKAGNGIKVGTFTTNEKGVGCVTYAYFNTEDVSYKRTTLSCMPIGYYLCVETKSPKGYELVNGWDSPIKKDLTRELCIDEKTLMFVSVEKPVFDDITLEIFKVDSETGEKAQTQTGLDGAQFKVNYYMGYYDSVEKLPSKPARSWVLEAKTVDGVCKCELSDKYKVYGDDFYLSESGKVILPLGTITIEETRAPAGYELNGEFISEAGMHYKNKTFISRIEQNTGGVALLKAGHKIKVVEDVFRGRLSFTKKYTEDSSSAKGIPFEVSLLDGQGMVKESHIVVTGDDGVFDTELLPHSRNTNGNDNAKNMDDLEPVGIWFGVEDGAEADDNKYALLYGRYMIKELPCAANMGRQLLPPFEITISDDVCGDDACLELGELYNTLVPMIRTKATDILNGSKNVIAGENTVVEDTVSWFWLEAGKNYLLRGSVIDKETGEVLISDGREVVSESAFTVGEEWNLTSNEKCGETVVRFEFDTSNLEGKSLVIYEELYLLDENSNVTASPVAYERDLNEEEQTVHVLNPRLKTRLSGKVGEKRFLATDTEITLVDTVYYDDLLCGYEYICEGRLMIKETGDALTVNGQTVTGSVAFVPENSSGTVDVEFVFNAKDLEGKTLVAFERLTMADREDWSLVHEDINDVEQTVYFDEEVTTTEEITTTEEVTTTEKETTTEEVTTTKVTTTVKETTTTEEKTTTTDSPTITEAITFSEEETTTEETTTEETTTEETTTEETTTEETTTETIAPEDKKQPKTGDNTGYIYVVSAMLLSLGAAVILVVFRIRRR